MRVRRIAFAGTRTERFDAMTAFAADVLGLADAFEDPRLEGFGWLCFRAPDGNVYVLQQDHAPSTRPVGGGM